MMVPLVLLLACSIGIVLCGSFDNLIVNEHNRFRRMEKAANMQEMMWSKKVENAAVSWANQCTQGHQSEGYGENLYMYTANQPDSALVKKGIKAWYDEKSLWRWGAGFSGATGHYTQVVWADTNQVGCGVKICPPGGFFSRSYLYLVCFYLPPGNMMGQNPYKLGGVCSKCETGQQCNNGLCSGSSSGGGGSTGGGSDDGNDDNGNGGDDNGNGGDDNGNGGDDNGNGGDDNGWDNNGWDWWNNNVWDNGNWWYYTWKKRHLSKSVNVDRPLKIDQKTPVLMSRGHTNRGLHTQKAKLNSLFNFLKKRKVDRSYEKQQLKM